MKKLLVSLGLLLAVLMNAQAQQDPALLSRIDAMLKATQNGDLEKVLDYTYPKLFKIATRAQLGEAMKAAFNSEEFTTTLDSVNVTKLHPVFTIGTGQYALIEHNMLMRMKFKETIDESKLKTVIPSMEEGYGKGNVRFDKKNNALIIKINAQMVAVKDEFAKEWCFTNYDEDDEMTSMLFSEEVIDKLATYQ